MQKREIIFVYLPNTSHLMHFQSVCQKKGYIDNKTNKYRWHKPHQTTSLKQTLLLQLFGLVAFIEQKENDNNDNLCKIHGGLYIASALMKTTNNDVIV